MDTIMQSLAGLDNFALYFGLSIVFLFIFKLVYALVTPHDEWKLVKEEKNIAAAIGFGGTIIGFAIALGIILGADGIPRVFARIGPLATFRP